MKKSINIGDLMTHRFIVTESHLAAFESGPVHPVCSTFVLAREIEWASRLFILDVCEADEEGIGTMLHIEHKSPAFIEEEVTLRAEVIEFDENELICDIKVECKGRLVAVGKTGQKILPKEKITQIFTSLER